ncbi:MAG: alpha/beta hydrolase [Gammaproteobacteria bacterium]|nr:alpha/beta hydrolase [Gammaproteobacteria bacterium]MDH5629269.1 alpha/beta hydrolase [Gammaproteobacteria bacterium]
MIEYKVNFAGCDCAVVEWNPQASTTVFAFHGWLDNLVSFETVSTYMPEIHLVAVDFPGHGHSDHLPPGFSYNFVDSLFLIDEVADHFNCKSVNLLGHSMGGAISTLYAAARPNRVNKVALIESIGPLTADDSQVTELLRRAMNQRAIIKDKLKPVYENFAQALKARSEASSIDEQLIKPLVERGLIKVEGGYTWRADSRLRITSPVRMSESHLLMALKDIVAPILLIEADAGLLQEKNLIDKRKENISELQTEIISGGHHVHLEKPQICGKMISDFFLKSV